MIRADRPVDQPLDRTEAVFLRWYSDWFANGGEFLPAAMAMPGQSVNRSGHGGRSWFVLLADPVEKTALAPAEHQQKARRQLCMGIISMESSILPLQTGEIDGKHFTFRIDHVPEDHNYQHCQIEMVDGDSIVTDDKQWRKVRKWFRTELAKEWRTGRIAYLLRAEEATASPRG